MKIILLNMSSNITNLFSRKSLQLLVLIGIFGLQNAIAQLVATGYDFTQTQNQTYVPITGGTVFASTPFINTAPVIAPLGFTFNFNGTTYTDVYVTDNGFLVFTPTAGLGAAAPTNTTVTPISSLSAFPGSVSALGYNLQSANNNTNYVTPPASEVRYETITIGSQKVFVLQFTNVVRRTAVAALQNGIISMQIRLYETTNVIETLYDTFNPTAFGVTATVVTSGQQVGLRGINNVDFNNRIVVNADWSATAAGTVAGASMSLSNVVYNTTPTRFMWSPCYQPSVLTATLQGDNSTASISWTAASIAPTGGYDWEVRTTGNPGSGSPFASGNTSSTSISVPGLQVGITYYIYVKSNCKSTWLPVNTAPSTVTVQPVCPSATVPYSQNFESAVIPAIPTCSSVINSGTTLETINRAVTPVGGFSNKNLVTSGALASNSWYFTQQISFPTSGYYKLSYKYGGTSGSAATQKMKVAFGTTNTQAGMTTVVADHNSIKTSPLTNTVNFYATAGTYYLGFNAYADATQGSLQLDDIYLDFTTCVFPSALTSSQVGATTANISWTAPSPAPSGGYDYYVTTSPTPPTSTTPPTGSTGAGILLTSLSGLTSSTTYYFWVRSDCGGGDISAWVTIAGTFTTTFQPPLACTFPTPAPTASTTYFNNVTTTGAITNINNSSGFSTNGYGNYTNLIVTSFPTATVTFTTGISGPSVGIAIWVDWNNDGTFQGTERVFNTTGYVTTLSGTFVVPAAVTNGEYRMRFLMDYWTTNPSNPCTLQNNTSTLGEVEDYTFKVVGSPPALTLNIYNSTQCANVNSPLVQITAGTAAGQYSGFSWSPATGVSGNATTGYTFNASSSVSYTLTASQSVSPYHVKTVTYVYYANALPSPLTITPATTTICGSAAAIQLVATGGIVAGASLLSENFNTGATGWTTESTSSGTNPANANWTIRNSGYNPAGSSGISSVVSNDNSQFYVSNSDSQGPGGVTEVRLISPIFSLAGYTNASLSFYHYVKPFNAGYFAKVEIFSAGVWTPIQTWVYSDGTRGTPTNFELVSISLNGYLGQAGLKIRYNYYDRWGYIWAVDNVVITGTASVPTVTWTPNGAGNGIFTNAAGTTVYTGTSTPSVWVSPSPTSEAINGAITNSYIATVSTPQGCSITKTATIILRPLSIGTTSANQTVSTCTGSPMSDITVSSYEGVSMYWEYTDDPLLVSGWTTIPSSNATTLTVAQIGVLANTRYFRAVAINSPCTPVKSTVVTITTTNTTTWNGTSWSNGTPNSTSTAIFTGNYSSSGNLSACSVSVVSGTIVFNGSHTLNVQGAVQVTSTGSLIFENNASLVQTNSVANSGNITYKRDTTGILKYDYVYWSSPVNSQSITAFTPLSNLAYVYNPAITDWSEVPITDNMIAAKGYIVRAPSTFSTTVRTVFPASFIGVPNNGTYTTPVTAGKFNLIGNPYPSAISADIFLNSTNNPNVNGTIYLWTHNTPINTSFQYTSNDYALYNATGGTGTSAINTGINNGVPGGQIVSGQSFMIEGINTGLATFTNAMRVSGNNAQFFRNAEAIQSTTNIEKHRIWLDITNAEGAYKQLLVGYIQDATNNLDRAFDGELENSSGNVISFYTMVANKKLSIQGKALPFDVTDTIPLGYTSAISGVFTLNLYDFDGLFTAQNIYVEDLVTGSIHDLKSSSFSFATAIGTFENRFVLRFTTNALAVPLFNLNSVVVYKNDFGLHINTGNVLMNNVKLFDVAGRLIASRNTIGATETVFTTLPNTQQVLLVQITSQDGVQITKKVVY